MPYLCLVGDKLQEGKAIVDILPRDRVMLMEILHCNNCKVEDDRAALLDVLMDAFHSENH
jgi:hypothetical protein